MARPAKYKTPEQMQEIIDRYFVDCAENRVAVTLAGLAYALGMTTQALRDYGKKDRFLCTVKDARQYVEATVEALLLSGNHAAGAIFWLKNNAGWKDAQQVNMDHSGTVAIAAQLSEALQRGEP
jgi:hypothetical protein